MNVNINITDTIVCFAKKYSEIKTVLLFGSRARGDNSERSDYDIAVFTNNNEFTEQMRFLNDIDEIDTLYKFDVVIVNDRTDKKLLENIKRDGVVIMSNDTKISNYIHAAKRLEEALAECGDNPTSLNRDGVIQRFEFTTELGWKACREFLFEQGFVDLNSPKSVMKQAFQYGIILDGDAWIDILNDRNLTSHIYDEEAAKEIFERIKNVHIKSFLLLTEYFGQLI